MILNVTEEQKQLIESQGYLVIQYKKWCNDMLPFLERMANKILTDIQKIITFFQVMAVKIREAMQPIIDFADKFNESYELMNDVDIRIEESEKFPFIRSLGRKYRPYIRNKVIYHRCRDRC